MRPPTPSVPMPPWLVAAVVLAAVAVARPAGAETGALTPEVAAGTLAPVLAAPYVAGHPARVLAPAPALGIGVRYALDDDLEVGLRLAITTPVTVDHLWTQGPGDARLLEHRYQQVAAEALVRRYLAGLDWRVFVEGGLGWAHRRYFALQPYQVQGGQAATLGGALPAFAADEVVASGGPGIEYVWDHAAVGVRARLDARVGPAVQGAPPHPVALTWGFGAAMYLAFSFYP